MQAAPDVDPFWLTGGLLFLVATRVFHTAAATRDVTAPAGARATPPPVEAAQRAVRPWRRRRPPLRSDSQPRRSPRKERL
jgi:hypothetical protein